MTRIPAALFLVSLLALAAAPASAQQFEDIGDYRVHYNTLNTNLLPPEVARAYGVRRSANRAMLNIAVLRKADSENQMDTPVRAEVSAHAMNLTGQRRDIELQEVREEEAVYYIGTFRVANEETMNFTVSVRPLDGDQPPREFTFRQQFFTE